MVLFNGSFAGDILILISETKSNPVNQRKVFRSKQDMDRLIYTAGENEIFYARMLSFMTLFSVVHTPPMMRSLLFWWRISNITLIFISAERLSHFTAYCYWNMKYGGYSCRKSASSSRHGDIIHCHSQDLRKSSLLK